jgi:hypothetical protein
LIALVVAYGVNAMQNAMVNSESPAPWECTLEHLYSPDPEMLLQDST